MCMPQLDFQMTVGNVARLHLKALYEVRIKCKKNL